MLQGSLNASGAVVGVDREIALAYVKLNEQESSLFADNLALTNFSVPDYLTDYYDYSAWQARRTVTHTVRMVVKLNNLQLLVVCNNLVGDEWNHIIVIGKTDVCRHEPGQAPMLCSPPGFCHHLNCYTI